MPSRTSVRVLLRASHARGAFALAFLPIIMGFCSLTQKGQIFFLMLSVPVTVLHNSGTLQPQPVGDFNVSQAYV